MLITSYGIVCMILIENSMPLKSFNSPPILEQIHRLQSRPSALAGILGSCCSDWMALNRSFIAIRALEISDESGKIDDM